MSAATLSPEEQLHVDAIGIHDLDVLAEMEEHADDIVPCFHCEGEATWRRVIRCCGDSCVACDPCQVEWRSRLKARMAELGAVVRCMSCKHDFPSWARFEDIVREVEL